MPHVQEDIDGNNLRLVVEDAQFTNFRTSFDRGWEQTLGSLDDTTKAIVLAASQLCGISTITIGGRYISAKGDSGFTRFTEQVRKITRSDAIKHRSIPRRRLRDVFARR